VGCADTSTSDPNYPNFNPFLSPFGSDPFIFHTFRFQDDVVTDMGAFPGVNSSCESFITDNGSIVGGSENGLIDPLTGWPAMEAVVWKDGQVINLKTFGGNESFAIQANNHGQVVGAAADAIPDPFSFVFFGWGTETRAFLWTESQGLKDLGTLGGPDALATEINDRGQIFGASYINSIPNSTTGVPTFDGFFLENGHDQMQDIPDSFGGTEVNPFFLNNQGQAVGNATLPGDLTFHPFLWDGGALMDLGTFGGDNGEANWINDKGQAAGSADFPGDQIHHGALWTNGVMTDLGTVGGDLCSRAFSVNSKAQVVGGSSSCNGFLHAFVWQNGRMVDLNTLITPGSGLQLTFALDINDRGEISGVGVLPNGDQHAFLLIPCGKADEGCGHSTAGTSAATERSPAPVTQNPTTQGSPSPSDRMAEIRARLARRYPYRGFGTYQRD
jgi:probable HAF family extracellular repeat protein